MPTEIIMPQIGETVAEGVIVKWLKKPGERVEEGESLVEVETDKAMVEVPSPASGVLVEILAQEGEAVPVEQKIAIISETVTAAPEARPKKPAREEKRPALPVAEKVERKARYSPLVKKLADEHGVDLSKVVGTGIGGRVTKENVLAYIEQAKAAEPSWEGEQEEVIPLTGMRKAIAEHMVRSKQTSPHVTTVALVDMTRIVDWRERNKETFEKREGVHLTYLPFIIKATTDALKKFSIVNSSLVGDEIRVKRYFHLGIAVSIEQKPDRPDSWGLTVPVLRNADKKSIPELARESADLAQRARGGRLKPEELHGATFTITNPGAYGAVLSTPIIHQPQAAILSVEAITKMPVVINDAIAIRSMMYLCLSYDHRIIDGAVAVRFLQQIRQNLDNFQLPT
jgi:2-oxoglutarate dehydrogenase complex dihydrolipoamide succinyltransferase (E2) component